MPEPFILALPCKMVTLQLTVAAEQGMTNLEGLCVRAVLVGRRNIEALTKLFAVPERMIVDVVTSLWSKGYLSFDFGNGDLALTAAAAQELAAPKPLADGGQVQERKFVYEPVSGRILLAREQVVRPRPPTDSLELPLRGDIDVADLPQSALVQAVQAAITRERQAGLTNNVLRVSVAHRQFREPDVIQWVALRAAAVVDAQTRRVKVSLNDYAWESATLAISNHVADLVDSEPESDLAAKILRRAETTMDPAERTDVLLTRMAEAVAKLEAKDRTQLDERQRVLVSLGERIKTRLVILQSRRVDALCVQGVEGHRWAVTDMIENSTRQLLMVCPQIEYEQFQDLVPRLHEALQRSGMRLVVLWGRTPESRLSSRVQNALSDLATRYNTATVQRVRFARESCRTEACLVIQDNRRALVGSYCVTAPFHGTVPPVSVLLESAADGPPAPQAVGDLLDWARDELPYPQDRRGVLTRREDFGSASDMPPRSPDLLRGDWPEPGLDRDDAAVRLLADKWRSTQQALHAMYANTVRAGPEAERITEGEIRQISFDLIRAATRQLIVADDRTDPAIANSDLAKLLRKRQSENVVVQLIHPALKPRDAAGPFGQLAAGPNRVEVRKARGSSRLLVADDEVLIGSFSLLAESGGRFTPRYRRRSKIGVRLRGGGLAAEVAAAQGVAAQAPPLEPVPSGPAPSMAATMASTLLTMLRAPSDGVRAVVTAMDALEDPWEVLAKWQEVGVPAAELRAVAAAMMRSDLSVIGRGAWARWLILDAWRRRAWMEGALLAPLTELEENCLTRAAVLACALEAGPLGSTAVEAAIELHDGDSRHLKAVGAVGGMADCMVWADQDGRDALDLLSDALPYAWNLLARTTIDNFNVDEGRLPVGSLLNEQTRRDTLAGLNSIREGIVAEINDLEMLENRFNFPTGKALRRGLFAQDGVLTLIRSAASAGCAAFPPLAASLPGNVHDHLNALIKKAGETPMYWGNQVSFLRRIEGIVRRAYRIAAQAPAVLSPAGAVVLGPGQAAVAEHAAREWDRLLLETEELDTSFQPPLRAMLSRLEPLTTWTGQTS
jgi:hypothetical protein